MIESWKLIMKNRTRAMGAVFMIFGGVVILVPRIMFPVCGLDGSQFLLKLPGHHGCHPTLMAETILGVIAIITGMIPLFLPKKKVLFFSSIILIAIAALVMLFPSAITGLCKMPTMSCRLGTLPGLITTGIIMCCAGCAGIFMARKMT